MLWGTLFPILSELVQGTKVTVGPPFFNKVNVPLGLALLALTGIGPLIAWRKASTANLRRQFIIPVATGAIVFLALFVLGMRNFYALMAISLGGFVAGTVVQEFYRGARARHRIHGESYGVALLHLIGRNRRRYGGYIVHVGILLMFVAFTGMAFKVDQEATLLPGESVEVASPFGHTYRFTHLGVSQYQYLNRFVSQATVDVERDGVAAGRMSSEKRQHVNSLGQFEFQPSTEVAIRSSLQEDVYIVYAGSIEGTEEAVYRFTINPLVLWVWIGGIVLIVGGLITMWPGGYGPRLQRRPTQIGYEAALTAEGGGGQRTAAGAGAEAGAGAV